MLNWADQFNICCFLDNHEYNIEPHGYECLLAAGATSYYTGTTPGALNGLKDFSDKHKEWMFGHFSYDLKNELEFLHSDHPDPIGFPDIFFFVPETILILNKEELQIHSLTGEPESAIFKMICLQQVAVKKVKSTFNIKCRFSKAEYLESIIQLKKHILAGDCYEINFCQEFYQENVTIDPLQTYFSLSDISPNPFGGYYKVNNSYLLCASPERYLWKGNDLLISQPMKGTSKRNLEYGEEDERIKHELRSSSKDKSENVMIVDLVRNDLSKVSREGSVKVNELYTVYSFPQVHQMISTISGKADQRFNWTDYIRATFPMGSMTGAPKKRVMQLIEEYEKSRRGLFSGTIGYITPQGDFDFNVVIRSILYNSINNYLSYQVGAAITFYSDPEKEYEECLLKAAAIKKVLT